MVCESEWKNLTLDSRIKIVLHEYFGLMGLEAANYNFSSDIIIALNFQETLLYSCQLALFQTKYPVISLGSAAFIINSTGSGASIQSFPMKQSKDDLVFRVVLGKNYLRGTIEISKVDRKNKYFVSVKETKKVLFNNITFFDGEPIGVKIFQNDIFKLQVACTQI
jgi:hypothetical protein